MNNVYTTISSNEAFQALTALNRADILKVYSGKTGCACGCRGKYSYAAAHQELGSKDRGYPVSANEVNERQITRILNFFIENYNTADEFEFTIRNESGDSFFSLVLSGRQYTIYPLPGLFKK